MNSKPLKSFLNNSISKRVNKVKRVSHTLRIGTSVSISKYTVGSF